MSKNDWIISDLITDRLKNVNCSPEFFFESGEPTLISFYGARMLNGIESGKIKEEHTDEEIAKMISGGLLTWLFWAIARELLSWIVEEIRKRVWTAPSVGEESPN